MSTAGWHSHISGLSQLVSTRGPQRHREAIPRAALEEFRTSAVRVPSNTFAFQMAHHDCQMIQSVMYCKASFLGSDDWQNIPWEKTPKDVYQKLNDKGFALGALLEELESLDLSSLSKDLPKVSHLLRRLSKLSDDMDSWYQELIEASPSPIYWPVNSDMDESWSTDYPLKEDLASDALPSFAYDNFRLANITITYWGLRIVLGNTIAITCGAILSASGADHIQLSDHSSLKEAARQLFRKPGSTTGIDYAVNIMRSMPYCLSESMGLVGAQKSLFAIRTALSCLRRIPGEELRWCNAIYQQMDSNKGLRYAREIAKVGVGYTPPSKNSPPIRLENMFSKGESLMRKNRARGATR